MNTEKLMNNDDEKSVSRISQNKNLEKNTEYVVPIYLYVQRSINKARFIYYFKIQKCNYR